MGDINEQMFSSITITSGHYIDYEIDLLKKNVDFHGK